VEEGQFSMLSFANQIIIIALIADIFPQKQGKLKYFQPLKSAIDARVGDQSYSLIVGDIVSILPFKFTQ
jgi:hypothetical protein